LAPRKPVEMSHSLIFFLSRRLSWGIFNDTIFRAFWGWVDRLISLPLRVPGFPIEYSISSPIIINIIISYDTLANLLLRSNLDLAGRYLWWITFQFRPCCSTPAINVPSCMRLVWAVR
jgi:hypothetical protein